MCLYSLISKKEDDQLREGLVSHRFTWIEICQHIPSLIKVFSFWNHYVSFSGSMLSTFNWSWLFLYEENVSWDTKISTNNWKNFWDLFICWFVPVFIKHFESHFHIWFKRAYECVAAINTTSSIPCAPPPSPLLNIFLFILNINYNINNKQ